VSDRNSKIHSTSIRHARLYYGQRDYYCTCRFPRTHRKSAVQPFGTDRPRSEKSTPDPALSCLCSSFFRTCLLRFTDPPPKNQRGSGALPLGIASTGRSPCFFCSTSYLKGAQKWIPSTASGIFCMYAKKPQPLQAVEVARRTNKQYARTKPKKEVQIKSEARATKV
jgi:hypothetical protein